MARQALYDYTSTDTSATFAFITGDRISIRFEDLTPEIKHQLMVHGLKQKICDGAAIPRDTETGYAASNSDKIDAMQQIAHRLIMGQWNATREGSGGNTGGLLLKALCELYPNKTREQLADYLAGKTDKEKAALRASPKIAPIIDRIKAESGKSAGIDADELLADLG